MTNDNALPSHHLKPLLAFYLALALVGCDKFSGKTPLEHVQKAEEFRTQGDLRSSSIELKAALQQNPDLMVARQFLGEVNLALGDVAGAEKEIRQAMALGLPRKNALLVLAESLQLQDKHKEIVDEIDVPPSMVPQEQAGLHVYRGDAFTALGKFESAKVEYEEALKGDVSFPLAKLGLARLAAAYNDPQKAERLLDEALATAPTEAKLWSFRGDYYKGKGELVKAEESYTKAIENRKQNLIDRGNRALVLIDLKKYDAAEADAKVLREQAPNFFLGHHAEGLIAMADKDYAKGQMELEESLKLNPRYLPTYYYLGYAHLMQSHLAQAEQALAEFLKGFPGSAGGVAMMAVTKIQLGDYDGARKYATPLLKFAPQDPAAIEIMGIIEMAKGDSSAALKLLEKASSLDPKSALPQFGMAMGLLSKGEKEKGLAALETAAKLDENNANPKIILVLSEIQEGKFDKAQKLIDELKSKQPDSVLPLNLEGVLYSTKGQREQASERFQSAWAKAPGDPMAGLNLAQQAIVGNKPDEARSYYEKILEAHPKHLNTQLKLVELDAAQGKYGEVEIRLNNAIEQFPEAVQPRVILARHLNSFGQPQRALPLLQAIAGKYSKDPIFLQTYVETLLVNHQASPALEAVKGWVALAPNAADAHYWLARAYVERNDEKNASSELERALALDPALLPARIMKIRMATLKNPDEAVRLIEQLRHDQPNNVEVLSLAGWVARQQNRLEDSVKAYQMAFEKGKSSETVANLAQSQWLAGERAPAISTFEAWTRQYPQDWSARILLSAMYSDMGKEQDALTELQEALKADGSNASVLNELAWRLRKSDPPAALDYAEKAYGLAPTSPAIVDTLASLLLDKGSKERALQLLRAIRPQASGNFTVRFHYAVALAETGDHRAAAQELKELLAENSQFPERNQAIELFKGLSQQK